MLLLSSQLLLGMSKFLIKPVSYRDQTDSVQKNLGKLVNLNILNLQEQQKWHDILDT